MDKRKYTEMVMQALKSTYFNNSANASTEYLKGECRLLSFLKIDPERKYQPGELAKELGLTTARIASILKTLEKKGYILRECSPEDKRKVFVEITENGKEYIDKKRENACLFFDGAFEKLSEEESEQFIAILNKLTTDKYI